MCATYRVWQAEMSRCTAEKDVSTNWTVIEDNAQKRGQTTTFRASLTSHDFNTGFAQRNAAQLRATSKAQECNGINAIVYECARTID